LKIGQKESNRNNRHKPAEEAELPISHCISDGLFFF